MITFEATPQTPPLRFLASLSDGRTVIQDDRPGQLHAWFRLQQFLSANPDLKITALRVQNGSREFTLPANQAGYAFGKKVVYVSQVGDRQCVGAGYLDGECVHMAWLDPETLEMVGAEDQTVGVCGFKLIRNLNGWN